VLVVGAGGLGSPVLLYLAAAGVGTLGIVDDDVVDLTNLQRQIAHRTEDIGASKVASAAASVERINPGVQVVRHEERLDEHNVLRLVEPYDVIVDGVDNFAARYLLNDACVLTGKTLVEGGVLRYQGVVTVIEGGVSACYRCAFPEPPPPGVVPTCREAGVLGAVVGVIGTLQAAEVLKFLTKRGNPLRDRHLYYDALAGRFDEVEVRRSPTCPVCGNTPRITSLETYAEQCDLQSSSAATT
jgi:adenylyltransferase/sulfurtransferase